MLNIGESRLICFALENLNLTNNNSDILFVKDIILKYLILFDIVWHFPTFKKVRDL